MIESTDKIEKKVGVVGYALTIGGLPVVLNQEEMFALLHKLCNFLGLEFIQQTIPQNEVN